jgi:putative DNA primase/helicase
VWGEGPQRGAVPVVTEAYPVAYADKPHDYHWRPTTVTWDEIIDWVQKPAKRKECGNYILATLDTTTKTHPVRVGSGPSEPCTDVHRDNRSVSRRSAVLAMDVDAPEEGFDVVVELQLAGHGYILHTTHSSTPSEPRYRLLVQVDRDMAPDEYVEASTALANRLGKDQFDTGTFQPARFMFKPATRKPEWYDYHVGVGDPIQVDTLLGEYDREQSEEAAPRPGKNKRDPFTIEGPVGAFNRAYEDWDLLIETYELPYEKVSDDRYRIIGATSEAGMGPVADFPGLVYSHHAGDPAYGKACSAFDLVRLHLFGTDDEAADPKTPVNKLPSHTQMLDVATKDRLVIRAMFDDATADFQAQMDEEGDGETDWREGLRVDRNLKIYDEVRNWDLIKANDPVLGLLYFNLLTMSPEVSGDLPWRPVTPLTRTFDGIDHAELRDYLERTYRFRPSKEQVDGLVVTKAGQNRLSPIKDYLEQLVWDRKERVETCLPGASHSRYNALVARKVLAAAVARVYEPGLKWDHTLVLQGGEGLGKSTWIEKMAHVGLPERRTYHYTLGPISSKDTLLAMHMSWIVVSDEGHSLRKSDNDALKEFLTRTHDVFRMPYDRDTVVHPRQCVIWSTTNDDVFLRRQEGNRRFLMVRCLERFDIDGLTPELVDQLWAEAVHMYKAGERLYLTDDEALLAEMERDPFLEEDTNAGVIEHFLDTLVPEDWWSRSPESRMQWKEDRANGFESEGTMTVDKTCSRQLWHEAFGQRIQPRKMDLLELTASLKAIGWVSTGLHHFPGYGTQTVFVRKEDIL